MNPQSPKNINNGRSMDVMPGDSSNLNPASSTQSTQQPPQPVANTMAPADGIAQATEMPAMSQSASPKSRKIKTKTIVLIVILSVFVLGGLLGGLLYMNSRSSSTSNQEQELIENTQTTNSQVEGRVSTAEIDTTIDQIDKVLITLNDSTDFTPDDLSNASLGLQD